MSHNNKIQDTETHFIIDPLTRAITTASSGNNTIVQHDHNSERFTFEMPRYVDGHDMCECTDVRIHYRNSTPNGAYQISSVYVPDDLVISPNDKNTILFSWLLSSATAQYIGHLHFSIQFLCLDGDTVEYAWNTCVYEDVEVKESINSSEVVVEQYPDVLEQWRQELFEAGGDAVVNVNTATENALSAIEAKGAETIDSIPADYTTLVQDHTELAQVVDENRDAIIKTGEIVSQTEKRLTNIEQGLPEDNFLTDASVAYRKDVPTNALPYAEVSKIGGMTYKDGDVLRSASVTEVKSVGANLLSEQRLIAATNASDDGGYIKFSNQFASISNTLFKSNTVYTLSFVGKIDVGNGRLAIKYTDGTVDNAIINSTTDVLVTIHSNAEKTIASIDTSYGDSGNVWIKKGTLMLNEGVTALPYTPYHEHTLSIPEEVRPANGINENVYDYIEWAEDGSVKKTVKCGVVDLGEQQWNKAATSEFYADIDDNIVATLEGYACLCAKYTRAEQPTVVNNGEMVLATKNQSGTAGRLFIVDNNYTDAETFKAAMSGVMLVYELAKPIVTDITDKITADNFVYVEGGGTLTFVNEYGYDVPSEVEYQVEV